MSNGLTNSDGRLKFYRQLRKEDTVALESGAMSFMMAKEMERAVGCKVIVLQPSKLAVIYRSMKKTDKSATKLPRMR
jgi:hypothetical protein